MERWVGKVAVVTGASAGIGAAIAVTLANAGLIVVGAARRVEQIEVLKKQVTGKGELHAVQCDVGKEEDILSLFQWVKENLKSVHVLVNNAGIIRPGKLVEQDTKFLKDVLDVNVLGLTICTREAFKLMKETGVDDGHIIHINSVVGHQVFSSGDNVMYGMYAASKFAVTAITETQRQELRALKTKIRITAKAGEQTVHYFQNEHRVITMKQEFRAPDPSGGDNINSGSIKKKINQTQGKKKKQEKMISDIKPVSLSPGFVSTDIIPAALKAIGMNQLPVNEDFKIPPALEAQNIADGVVYVLSAPPHVQVHELTIKPLGEQA